jgi:hypothetical protein
MKFENNSLRIRKSPRGGWPGNRFWERSPYAGRRVGAPSAFRKWMDAHPEEAKRIEERFKKEGKHE